MFVATVHNSISVFERLQRLDEAPASTRNCDEVHGINGRRYERRYHRRCGLTCRHEVVVRHQRSAAVNRHTDDVRYLLDEGRPLLDHLDRRVHPRLRRILPTRGLGDHSRQLRQRPLGALVGLNLGGVVDVHVRPDGERLGETTLQSFLRIDAGRALTLGYKSHKPLACALDGFEDAGVRALTDLHFHLWCLLG